MAMLPQFHGRPELHRQSLSLRHVLVEANEAFGGGGKALGAAFSLTASTASVESVNFVGNTQRGVGAGIAFATGSNVTFSFVRFEGSRNLGLGAGVLVAMDGSRVEFSHSQFLGSFVENQMGLPEDEEEGICTDVDTFYTATSDKRHDVSICAIISPAAWHESIDMSSYSLSRVCHISREAVLEVQELGIQVQEVGMLIGGSCKTFCKSIDQTCLHAQRSTGQCSVGEEESNERSVDRSDNGCNEEFGRQICGCSKPHETIQSASCITVDASTVSATHSLFDGNDGGDVIVAHASSTVDLIHSTFQKNRVHDHSRTSRATLSLWDGSIATLVRVSFSGNDGVVAGALSIAGIRTAATVNHVKFNGNYASAADAAGGAIFVTDGATVRGTGSTFDGNRASSQLAAGAVYATGAAEVILTDAMLTDNEAGAHLTAGGVFGAGAIYANRASISLIRSTITSNRATGGTALTETNYADALYIRSPLHIFVQDGKFEPLTWGGKTVVINPQILPGSIVQGSCQQHPCTLGSACSYANFSVSCTFCPGGTHSSDGISCELCPPATGPSLDQARCEPCGGPSEPLVYSPFGVCLECHGDNVVSADRTRCDLQGSSFLRFS
jgi:hypothetical protein